MNVTGLGKYAGALVVIAICSACSGALRQAQDDMAVAPSTASFNATYSGKMLLVNGRPVTAARLNPAPTYATIVPDLLAKARHYEYIINFYGTYATIVQLSEERSAGRYDYERRRPRMHERPLRLWEENLLDRCRRKPDRGVQDPQETAQDALRFGRHAVELRHEYQRRPRRRDLERVGYRRRCRHLQERHRLGHRHDHAVGR